MVPSRAIEPPKKITIARPRADSTSTAGNSAAVNLVASRFAPRCSALARPKLLTFASSRLRLWTTLTPEMFSCRPELTTAMAFRTRMNERRA